MKKNAFFILLFLAIGFTSVAQKFRGIDKSPMDMSYYPDNFSHDRKFAPEKVGDKAYIRVIYTRPAKKEREVFGKLVAYDKLWRVGGNEATEIKFYQNVTIMGQKIKAGTYTLYAIPTEKEWTIIINKDLDVWGEYSYNEKQDVLRVKVPTKQTETAVENLSIQFSKNETKGADMHIAWDNTMITLPIEF